MICIDIKTVTKTDGPENSWKLGNCSSTPWKDTYYSNSTHIQQCCQPQATYELSCIDSYGNGWQGGYIEVMDGKETTKYCENFNAGSEETHNVTWSGTLKFADVFSSTKKIFHY